MFLPVRCQYAIDSYNLSIRTAKLEISIAIFIFIHNLWHSFITPNASGVALSNIRFAFIEPAVSTVIYLNIKNKDFEECKLIIYLLKERLSWRSVKISYMPSPRLWKRKLANNTKKEIACTPISTILRCKMCFLTERHFFFTPKLFAGRASFRGCQESHDRPSAVCINS